MTPRELLRWVHLLLGLTAAVILAVVSLTGAYITFQEPLRRVLNPVPGIPAFAGTADIPAIVREVERQFAPRRVASVDVRKQEATVVRLRDRTAVFVDPRTSAVISSRPGRVASLENLTTVMRRLHTTFMLGPRGRLLVTFATTEALLLALSGVWLWWKKKHWRFTRWRGSLFLISWDLHSATGIWFAVPVLSMVITGLLLAVPGPVYRLAGAPPAPWLNAPYSAIPDGGNASSVTLSRVLFAADSATSAEPTVRLVIPRGPAGAFAVAKAGRTAYIDQYSGAVLEVRADRAPTAGDSANEAVEQLHTGELLGVPGRAVMTLGSLMLAVMTVTGVALGWKRLTILLGVVRRREASAGSALRAD